MFLGGRDMLLGFVLKNYRKQKLESWVFVILSSPSLPMFENFRIQSLKGKKEERPLLNSTFQSAHVPLSGTKCTP